MAERTRAGSRSGARSTKTAPSAKDRATSLCDGQRQARLADPAGTGQGQRGDSLVEQEITSGRALGLSADEPRARTGERSGEPLAATATIGDLADRHDANAGCSVPDSDNHHLSRGVVGPIKGVTGTKTW